MANKYVTFVPIKVQKPLPMPKDTKKSGKAEKTNKEKKKSK